jgi:hypothetical protein
MLMDGVVLILESRNPVGPGDLNVFKSIAAAENYLEAIDVINGEHFGYTLAGKPLILTAHDGRVSITEKSNGVDNPTFARGLLEATARIVLSKRGDIVAQLSHYSVQDLVQIVGFSGRPERERRCLVSESNWNPANFTCRPVTDRPYQPNFWFRPQRDPLH